MKIIIIGAGISGVLASKIFNTKYIFDSANTPEIYHKAIMRIRDQRIGMLLGCGLKPITVRKGIFYKGDILTKTNIKLNNLYSLKVSGELSDKSVLNLDDSERFLLEGNWSNSDAKYNYRLIKINNNEATFIHNNEEVKESYDVCISTIPIFNIMESSDLKVLPKESFRYNPIYVSLFKINIPSKIYQTIYLPEPGPFSYRASIEGNKLTIESVNGFPSEEEVNLIADIFGIDNSVLIDREDHIQKIGKIISIDENIRKFILYELTNKFNIFSLGRFAIWKQIRADEVLSDLEKIERMIRIDELRRSYENKLNQLY